MIKVLKSTPARHRLIIGSLALFNVLLHLAVIDNLEFHRDELLYFSLGLHPDVGYASVPPMIGWIAALLQNLLGHSVFAAKAFPALLSGFFVILASAVTRELGGKMYARILTGIAIIIAPFTLRTFHLFQPVHLDLIFWTSLLYLTIRYTNTRNDKLLLIIGAGFGLAMLNKYLVALLLAALLISIFFSPYKDVFRKKEFYWGLLLGLLVFMPNLAWQLTHGLPVLQHLRELNKYQLSHVSRITFFSEQLLLSFAASIFFLTGMIYLLWKKKYRYLFVTAAIVIVALAVMRGKSYYTLGVMPVMIAAGAVAVERLIKNQYARTAIPVFLILITLPILPISIPIYRQDGLVVYFKKLEEKYGITVGRRFEDGSIHSLPQDYADQLGWEELTQIAAKAYELIPQKSGVLIFCENYGQAGAIAISGKKYNLPQPVSFSESFLYWAPQQFQPDIEYLIYINDELGEDVRTHFRDIQVVGRISNIHAREYGTIVYLCSKPVRSFNQLWHAALERQN